ncbi:metal ABC transporter permease [Amaricoccus macauensis]|uniref:metal ABC transporter permease n=1 Tax=Amaricoccus macauensis TaxID=57001 RepID=UPI003C7AFFB5
MTFLDDFFVRAMIGGLGVALAAGPLGCFVVWRRMAYFGDATAHAALLGVTLALATDLPVVLGVTIAAIVMAIGVTLASGRTYAVDTMLGVASHGALALGLVALSLLPGVRIDLSGFLFGDILAVSRGDLAFIWGGAIFVAGLVVLRRSTLLLSTLNEELAVSAGVNPARERMILTLALALLVAIAIKAVGVLLITAMLIIPAATARALSRTPETMMVLAVLAGAGSVVLGLEGSLHLDLPAGPAIVTAAVLLLVVANAARIVKARARR